MDKDETDETVEEIIIKTTSDNVNVEISKGPPKTAKDLLAGFSVDEYDLDAEEEEEEDPLNSRAKTRKKNATAQKANTTETQSKKRSFLQKYRKDWENIPLFKKWLSESSVSPRHFYCKICKLNGKCGKSEIIRHMSSKKHTKNSQSARSKTPHFEGLLCPVFTPFENIRYNEVDYNKIYPYAQYLLKNNVQAIVINDIIGEGMSLTISERCNVVEEWIKVCDGHKMYTMVQIGGAPMKEIVRMARHGVSKKVNAFVLLPDLYNRPKNHYDLLQYIKDVSEYTSNLPIWYHHCPDFTNVQVDLKKFMEDAAEIISFAGIIVSGSFDELLLLNNNQLRLIPSTQHNISGATVLGLQSLMSSAINFLPKMVQDIFSNCERVDTRKTQNTVSDVFNLINEQENNISAQKTAMKLIAKVDLGSVRKPLMNIWKSRCVTMETELKSLGLIV